MWKWFWVLSIFFHTLNLWIFQIVCILMWSFILRYPTAVFERESSDSGMFSVHSFAHNRHLFPVWCQVSAKVWWHAILLPLVAIITVVIQSHLIVKHYQFHRCLIKLGYWVRVRSAFYSRHCGMSANSKTGFALAISYQKITWLTLKSLWFIGVVRIMAFLDKFLIFVRLFIPLTALVKYAIGDLQKDVEGLKWLFPSIGLSSLKVLGINASGNLNEASFC